MKNYYQVLGINSDSSSNEIKKAYRSLTLKHHPDKNNNSQDSLDKTQELNDAYSILGDPEKRKSYDYKLKLGISDDEIHMEEFNDINNLFSTLFKNINENTSPSFNNSFIKAWLFSLFSVLTTSGLISAVLAILIFLD